MGTRYQVSDLLNAEETNKNNQATIDQTAKSMRFVVILMAFVIVVLIIVVTILIIKVRSTYEDYDDYDDDEDDDKPSARKKLFSGSKKSDDEDTSTSFTMSDKPKNSRGKVVPIKQTARGLEVVVIRPESMEDASEITDTLLSGKAVVLNLEGIHVEIAQRIIDYSAGSCYSIRGNLQKITNYIFLVTPPNVDISGDIPEIVAGGIDLTSFKNDTKF